MKFNFEGSLQTLLYTVQPKEKHIFFGTHIMLAITMQLLQKIVIKKKSLVLQLLTPFEDTIFHLGVFETEDMLYFTGIDMFPDLEIEPYLF